MLRILSRCARSLIRQVIVEERQQRDSRQTAERQQRDSRATAEGGALRCEVAFSLGVMKNSPQSSNRWEGVSRPGCPPWPRARAGLCTLGDLSEDQRGDFYTVPDGSDIVFKSREFLKHTMTQADKEGQPPAARRWAENWSPHIKLVKMIDGNDPGDAVPATTWHTCEFPSCG